MIKTFRLLNKVEKNIKFELTDLLINQVIDLVDNNQNTLLLAKLNELHHADIAEILEELNVDQSIYIIKLLESDKTSEILMELDEDFREQILNKLSPKEIAKEIEELDTDDATDIISELSVEKQKKVISKIIDAEHKADIKEL